MTQPFETAWPRGEVGEIILVDDASREVRYYA
jgi:hypothetical protein